jgi:hypothetical protein
MRRESNITIYTQQYVGTDSTPDLDLYAGATLTTPISDNTWYADLGTFSTSVGLVEANGTSNTGSTGNQFAADPIHVCYDDFNHTSNAKMMEAGWWNNLAFSSGQRSSLPSNMRAAWSF